MDKDKIKRASWEDTVEHYNTSSTDWGLIIGTGFIIGFGVVLLITLI